MAGILYKTYTIRDGRVDLGDVWQIVGGRLLEAQREESLRNIAGDNTSTRMSGLTPSFLALCLIEVPTMDYISISATPRCIVAPPVTHLAAAVFYSAATQQKGESWLRRQNTNLMSPNEPFSIETVDQLAHTPEQRTTVIVNCNLSFRLCSTWVTLCIQEAFDEAHKVELNTQAALMATYLDIERYHSHHHNAKSELLYLWAKMLRAKAEVEVFELAIENAWRAIWSALADKYRI
ncbi:hypothetical protein DFH29DRAFT_876057 [Suillus ampliporus]|nr:hypothetical protein DFH29DRAFT_876057 [Suillus ampliporus]